jgi:hypothetical protein
MSLWGNAAGRRRRNCDVELKDLENSMLVLL